MGEPVCFQRVQAAAITTTVENPSDVATFGTRPKYLDLRQAKFSKAEEQSSDVEKKISSPMKSGVSHSWQAAEHLLKSSSGFKLHQLNAERESEEEDDEEDAEEDESQVDPLEKMMRLAMTRMMNPSGAASSNQASIRRGLTKPPVSQHAPGGVPSSNAEPDLNTMVMLLMARKLLGEKGSGSNDFEEDGDLNGMKVMKAMSRSRAQRDHMALFPRRHVQEYRDSWERELFGGLHGKPWVWDDVVREIGMAERHRSMHRMFIAFGEIERLCQGKSFGQAQLQAVQSMKAIHQFTLDSLKLSLAERLLLAQPLDLSEGNEHPVHAPMSLCHADFLHHVAPDPRLAVESPEQLSLPTVAVLLDVAGGENAPCGRAGLSNGTSPS